MDQGYFQCPQIKGMHSVSGREKKADVNIFGENVAYCKHRWNSFFIILESSIFTMLLTRNMPTNITVTLSSSDGLPL